MTALSNILSIKEISVITEVFPDPPANIQSMHITATESSEHAMKLECDRWPDTQMVWTIS